MVILRHEKVNWTAMVYFIAKSIKNFYMRLLKINITFGHLKEYSLATLEFSKFLFTLFRKSFIFEVEKS